MDGHDATVTTSGNMCTICRTSSRKPIRNSWIKIAGLRHRLVHHYEDTNWIVICAIIFDCAAGVPGGDQRPLTHTVTHTGKRADGTDGHKRAKENG